MYNNKVTRQNIYESHIAPNAGMLRLTIPYTTFCVNFWLEITQTASALNSRTSLYVNLTMSGLPCVRVSYITAPGDFSKIESTNSSPNVFRTFGDVHKRRIGTRCARIHGAQGPIPDPVATNTSLRNNGTIRNTPAVGMLRTHRCVGGLAITSDVQSPARETTSEYPFTPGSCTVANPCHSRRGLFAIRVKVPGTGVTGKAKTRLR